MFHLNSAVDQLFVLKRDRKRTCARILSVHVCFAKPVQRVRCLVYSLAASQHIKETFLDSGAPGRSTSIPLAWDRKTFL